MRRFVMKPWDEMNEEERKAALVVREEAFRAAMGRDPLRPSPVPPPKWGEDWAGVQRREKP